MLSRVIWIIFIFINLNYFHHWCCQGNDAFHCSLLISWHWHPTNRCWRAEILIFRFHWGNWILSHQNHCAGETRNFGLQTFKKKFIVFILWKEIPCVHSWHFARSDFLSVWRRLEDTILRSLARRGWSSRCFVITHLCWDRYLWIFLSWLFSTEIYIKGQSG